MESTRVVPSARPTLTPGGRRLYWSDSGRSLRGIAPFAMTVLAVATPACPAHAEDRFIVEEVIVTARRIEESDRDVPIAMNAFTEATIEDRRIVGIADLQTYTPSLRYTTNDFSDASISIRGIGTRVAADEAQGGVSLHINEIPLPNGAPPIELFDVERIEVLRGPQGTLYGRNATGGAINIITAKPEMSSLHGHVDVEMGNKALQRMRGALNLPITETIALRVAGLSLQRDGHTDNLAGGQVPGAPDTVDGRDLDAVRISALWRPSDRTHMWLSVERFNENDNRMFTHQRICKAYVTPFNCEYDKFGLEPWGQYGGTALNNGVLGVTALGAKDEATGLIFRYPRPPITDLRQVHIDFEPINELDLETLQIGFSHAVGDAQLSVNAGYQRWDWHHAYDFDWSVGYELSPTPFNPSGIWPISVVPSGVDGLNEPPCEISAGRLGVAGGCISGEPLTRYFGVTDRDEEMAHWSTEVRLDTPLNDTLSLQVGAIYEHSEIDSLDSLTENTADLLFSPGSALTGLPLQHVYPTVIANPSEFEFESRSIFGEVYWSLRDDLELTLGLRYNDDEQRIADAYYVPPNALDANRFGTLGPDPRLVRSTLFLDFVLGIPQADSRELLDLYNAADAVSTAATYGGLIDALQLVPIVPPPERGSPNQRLTHQPTLEGLVGSRCAGLADFGLRIGLPVLFERIQTRGIQSEQLE